MKHRLLWTFAFVGTAALLVLFLREAGWIVQAGSINDARVPVAQGSESKPEPSGVAGVTGPGYALAGLPLRFVANAGQADAPVHFTVKGAGHTVFFTEREVVFVAIGHHSGEPGRSVVRLRFLGANPRPAIVGLDPLPGEANYYLGNDPAKWRANVPTYAAVVYRGLYPGIDLAYSGVEGQMKSEFRLEPGVDPSTIQMVYDGVQGMRIGGDGSLVLETSLGELVDEAPLIYQLVEGERRQVQGAYAVHDEGRVGFQVGPFDPDQALVIDPVLAYASYLGGGSTDYGRAIAVDGGGNMYVVGKTWSTDFPIEGELYTAQDGADVFVTQIRDLGGSYAYGFSSYLGGSANDEAYGVAVDTDGNVYVAGETRSTDFPVHEATQPAPLSVDGEAFVTRLTRKGTAYALGFSTYLGGSTSSSTANDVAVDNAGNVYVTGFTYASDFPLHNALDATRGGSRDAFLTKYGNAAGVYTYTFSTYLGGNSDDLGEGIALDGAGRIYIGGYTGSTSDFPLSNDALQTEHAGGNRDGFVTVYSSAGDAYVYSSYLGGGESDFLSDIAVDQHGDVHVAGRTYSSNLPVTGNALQPEKAGGYTDGFVARLSLSSTPSYAYLSYLGGEGEDDIRGLDVDAEGNAYVTGHTQWNDFPLVGSLQPAIPGEYDVFVTKLVSTGGVYTYEYSTLQGGTGIDYAYGIAVDDAGGAYVVGHTPATNVTTHLPTQPTSAGGEDAYVFKILDVSPSDLSSSIKAVHPSMIGVGDVLTYTLSLRNTGQRVATAELTDTLPVQTGYVSGSARASHGGPVTVDGAELHWSGQVISGTPVVIEFAAQVGATPEGTEILNRAEVSYGLHGLAVMTATSIVNPDYGLLINDGTQYANVPTVTLRYLWDPSDGITDVMFSRDNDFPPGDDTSGWMPVSEVDPTYQWVLDPPAKNLHFAYARFRDSSGGLFPQPQELVKDLIHLDTGMPKGTSVEIVTGTVQSVAGISDIDVILRVTAHDANTGVDQVHVSHYADFGDSAEFPFTGPTQDYPWTLQPSGAVHVRAVDRAGNVSEPAIGQGPARYDVYLPAVLKQH